MTRKRAFMWVQSAVCVLFVALLITAAIGIYREGAARRAEDPLAWIYTSEAVAQYAKPALALATVGLVMTVVGRLLGFGDETADNMNRDGGISPMNVPFRGLNAVRWAVLGIAVVCIVAGVLNGTMHDVLAKAIRVCSECIGLG